jgi:hypothetical protein
MAKLYRVRETWFSAYKRYVGQTVKRSHESVERSAFSSEHDGIWVIGNDGLRLLFSRYELEAARKGET